jgi:hypothetical protein
MSRRLLQTRAFNSAKQSCRQKPAHSNSCVTEPKGIMGGVNHLYPFSGMPERALKRTFRMCGLAIAALDQA